MVDNFERIRPFLKWGDPDKFYWVQITKRKKDGEITHGNKNNSARIIASYDFYTEEEMYAREEEIKAMCQIRNARAGINMNRRSQKMVSDQMLYTLIERRIANNYRTEGLGNTIRGGKKGKPVSKDKIWLVDCDTPEEQEFTEMFLNDPSVRPVKNKIITKLPTNSGMHFITEKFDTKAFVEAYQKAGFIEIAIHQNNPTALYYP